MRVKKRVFLTSSKNMCQIQILSNISNVDAISTNLSINTNIYQLLMSFFIVKLCYSIRVADND